MSHKVIEVVTVERVVRTYTVQVSDERAALDDGDHKVSAEEMVRSGEVTSFVDSDADIEETLEVREQAA